MPRALSLRSRDRMRARIADTAQHLGARLGLAAVQYGVPAAALARCLKVSDDTVYRWMYRDEVPAGRHKEVRRLITSIPKWCRPPLTGTVAHRTAAFIARYTDDNKQGRR